MRDELMSLIGYSLTFVAGCILGYCVGKKRYEKIYKEAADSVTVDMPIDIPTQSQNEEGIAEPVDENEFSRYKDSITESGYQYRKVDEYVDYTGAKIEILHKDELIDIIRPDEFLQANGFQKIYLIYYVGDGSLVEVGGSVYDKLDPPEDYVGKDALDHFGMYEPDLIHVRNRHLGIDYEIQVDMGCGPDIE